MSRAAALTYLQSPSDSNWRWADDCSVIVWHDGTTIAFREELEPLLETQAANGLPPFGAIVLLLAACKGKLPAESDFARTDLQLRTETPAENLQLIRTARERYQQTVSAALAELAKVASLPSDLIKGAAAKRILVEAAFESLKDDRRRDGVVILRQLKEPFNLSELNLPPAFRGGPDALRHLHIVSQGLKTHTAERLRLRIETGLDQLPGTPELDLLPAERARRLLQELQNDPEQAGFARIARDLLAAIRLPRALSEPDEQAIGGVSDLSNRGRLDRLLLSELAHDDLTLAARVALNEALYLRQEPPRREPEGGFSILIDAGVRLWGVPRVMATAATLALIAQGGHRTHVQCWRAHGNILARADLLTRPGLSEHLGALATEPHPGAALPAWLAGLDKSAETDAVLVTHFDTWADEEFRRALAQTGNRPFLVLLVDRDGRFELHSVPGMKAPVASAQVDVESLFAAPTTPTLRNPDSPNDLPAIFRVKPFPILLPVTGEIEDCLKWKTGGVCLTTDGRIWHWQNQSRGARVIGHITKRSRLLWWEVDDNGAPEILTDHVQENYVSLTGYVFPEGDNTEVRLQISGTPKAAVRSSEGLWIILENSVQLVESKGGNLSASLKLPVGMKWLAHRYFWSESGLFRLALNGGKNFLEPVPIPSGVRPENILTAFDNVYFEGAFIVTRGGKVISPQGVLGTIPLHPISHIDVSRDGTKIRAHEQGRNTWELINTLPFQVHERGSGRKPHGLGDKIRFPTRTLRNRFVAIATSAADSICVQTPRGKWLALNFSTQHQIVLGEDSIGNGTPAVQFKPNALDASTATKLETATWPDGSRAWLDNRGLLHLRSSDSSIPEITFTLNEGAVAVWLSTGEMAGPDFFFEDAQKHSSSGIKPALTGFARTAAASVIL